MKKKNLLFSLFTLLVLSAVVTVSLIPNANTQTVSSEEFEENEQGIDGAMKFYHSLKANFQTGEIEYDKITKAGQEARKFPTDKSSNLEWEEMGPNNVGGRVRALLIDNSNSSIMYAGGVNGGLWKSTTAGQSWVEVPLEGNNAISSICQTPNGDIFVGTGEGLAQAGYTNFNTGTYGDGVYFKAKSSNDFTHLSSTDSWTIVNRLAADKNNKVYAATNKGLFSTTDKGVHWNKERTGEFSDVKAAKDKVRIVATVYGAVYISNNGTTWDKVTDLPSSGIKRIEIAISPSDADYIYAVIAKSNGELYGIYRTSDGGTNWNQIAVGGSSSFELFGPNNQGWYDIAAMVHMTNPDILYVGGVDMWKGVKVSANNPFSWTKITLWNAKKHQPFYVHADQHVYVQHPTDPNTFYAGTDGGISKTIDGGANFATLNKNFNVTQFYSVAPHPNGGALAGAQDNGTQFIDLQGNNPMQARDIRGGDGGWCAASMLNQDVLFASIYYGDVGRSKDFGEEFQPPKDLATEDPEFYTAKMISGLSGTFVTSTVLWETIHFPNSIDSVRFIADTTYAIGDTLDGRSRTNNFYPFYYETQQSLATGDTIFIKDPVQSRLFVSLGTGIWMTKEALFFENKTPVWYKVTTAKYSGMASQTMRVSMDGDIMYYAVANHLRRLSNLLQAQDESTADVDGANYIVQDDLVNDFNGEISSISIDPEDANRVIITLGGTGNNQVYYSENATSATPTFDVKKGNLISNLPVYASLIPLHNSQQVIIGTEYGMFRTDNITASSPNWVKVNNGFNEAIPVYMIAQQQFRLPWRKTTVFDDGNPITQVYPGVYNEGQIYIATHGRGVFTSKSYVSIEDKKSSKVSSLSDMKLYPNPVEDIANFDYKLANSSEVIVNIFDISGRMLRSENLGSMNVGEHKSSINLGDLSRGTYILQIRTENSNLTKKFIKR